MKRFFLNIRPTMTTVCVKEESPVFTKGKSRDDRKVMRAAFLKDVALLSLTCFGGAQAHLSHFENLLVRKRKYLKEADLMELNALCQVLPGPTSTQILTAVGNRLGGQALAYITLLVWVLPSIVIMILLAMLMSYLQMRQISLSFLRYVQPAVVGFLIFSTYTIGIKTVHSRLGFTLMVAVGVTSYFVRSPFIFPLLIAISGAISALNYRQHPKAEKERNKYPLPFANLILWAAVLIAAAVLGGFTKKIPELLPIRLFENFYRNGSMVFGGGQALTPMLYTEFVEFAPKRYLTPEEFLSGYALSQSLPGPVFSFSAYIGTLAMRQYGLGGQIAGAVMSAAGIFLPGIFFIFFMVRVWNGLKSYRFIRASLEGIHAAGVGFVLATAIILFQPLEENPYNYLVVCWAFLLFAFTKIPPWAIMGMCIIMGIFI